eukprot:12401526-Karenia_brevis.AAC.1
MRQESFQVNLCTWPWRKSGLRRTSIWHQRSGKWIRTHRHSHGCHQKKLGKSMFGWITQKSLLKHQAGSQQRSKQRKRSRSSQRMQWKMVHQ